MVSQIEMLEPRLLLIVTQTMNKVSFLLSLSKITGAFMSLLLTLLRGSTRRLRERSEEEGGDGNKKRRKAAEQQKQRRRRRRRSRGRGREG